MSFAEFKKKHPEMFPQPKERKDNGEWRKYFTGKKAEELTARFKEELKHPPKRKDYPCRKERTNLSVTIEVRRKLRSIKRDGETYDQLIRRLLKHG